MSPLTAEAQERARQYESLILQQLASVGQRTAAAALDVSESTVSRMKGGEIETMCRLLAALELQVVHGDAVTKCPEYLKSLETLALLGLKHESGRT